MKGSPTEKNKILSHILWNGTPTRQREGRKQKKIANPELRANLMSRNKAIFAGKRAKFRKQICQEEKNYAWKMKKCENISFPRSGRDGLVSVCSAHMLIKSELHAYYKLACIKQGREGNGQRAEVLESPGEVLGWADGTRFECAGA